MMSWIAGDFYRTSPALTLALLALGIQATVFLGVALRTLFANREVLMERAQMPLNDEESGHE